MKRFVHILTVTAAVLATSSAFAAEVLNFAPSPVSPTIDEFVWDGDSLSTGSGATSNGDGNLHGGAGDSTPGLLLSTPFSISGVSSSQQNADGSTNFYDASMSLTGFVADGAAGQIGSTIVQPLSGGTFSIFSSSDTVGGSVLLLSGTLTDATITGIAGQDTGSVLSADITYTGGLIFDAMQDAGLSTDGSLSWSLVDIEPDLAIDEQTGFLRAFGADGTGSFDADAGEAVIPAPLAFPAGLALLAVVGLVRRRRLTT